MTSPTDPIHTSHTKPTAQLPVFIMPGFHSSALTEQLLASLPSFVSATVIEASPVSPFEIYQWLQTNITLSSNSKQATSKQATLPIVAIGFSAGVVGLAGALLMWQQMGGEVAQFIAVDGWGVPIVGLPVTRMSHDRFTHLSTLPLGSGKMNFFAVPSVPHQQLWERPQTVEGIAISSSANAFWPHQEETGIPMSAATFIRRSLHKEWDKVFSWRAASSRPDIGTST